MQLSANAFELSLKDVNKEFELCIGEPRGYFELERAFEFRWVEGQEEQIDQFSHIGA